MSDRDELVAHLHGPYQWGYRDPMDDAGFVADDSPSIAADQIERDGREIERLTAENERLREALAGMIKYGHETRGIRVLEAFNKAKEALNGEGET